jgi:hypothetical protein
MIVGPKETPVRPDSIKKRLFRATRVVGGRVLMLAQTRSAKDATSGTGLVPIWGEQGTCNCP